MRRLGLVLAAALAMVVTTASPAAADRDLAVAVGRVTVDQVQLIAAVPGASPQQLPPVSVSRDGWSLFFTADTIELGSPPDVDLRATVVVVDTSAAMGATALGAAKSGLSAFADAAPADVAIGLVAAAGEPSVVVHPTRDRAALLAAIEKLEPRGNTAIYEGVRTATHLGAASVDRRVLVVAGSRDTADNAADVISDLTPGPQRIDLIAVDAARDGLGQLRTLVTASGGTRAATTSEALSGVLRASARYAPLVSITVAVPPELAGTTGTLTVTAGQGANRATGQVYVPFKAPASGSRAAVAHGPQVLGFSMSSPRVLGAIVFGTLLLAILLVASGLGGSVRETRLKQVEQFRLAARRGRAGGQTVLQVPEGGFARILQTLSERVSTVGATEERVARKLDRAGMTLRPGEWIAWRSGATLAGAVVLGLLGGLIGALFGAGLGWFGAGVYRRIRERRRKQAFADQLPEALQLIASSLRSGFSLAQAMDAVVQDSSPGPLTVELGRAMGEVRIGADLDGALERTAERLQSEDLAWAVMAMRIQRETGGNLAEILETTVETLRERERLRRHVRALSAEGRLSAYILIGMPFAMAAWLLLVRRDYLSALWTTPLGLAMLVGAAVLMAVGAAWMSRWVKVEV
jgi:Flp pilus assembly protein TadB